MKYNQNQTNSHITSLEPKHEIKTLNQIKNTIEHKYEPIKTPYHYQKIYYHRLLSKLLKNPLHELLYHHTQTKKQDSQLDQTFPKLRKLHQNFTKSKSQNTFQK